METKAANTAVLDLFEMANLYPATTGLPMTVWVLPRGHAPHAAHVKVNRAHGERMDLDDAAVMSIAPIPRLLEGSLAPADQRLVATWITINRAVLLDYWHGRIDTAGLIAQLSRVVGNQ